MIAVRVGALFVSFFSMNSVSCNPCARTEPLMMSKSARKNCIRIISPLLASYVMPRLISLAWKKSVFGLQNYSGLGSGIGRHVTLPKLRNFFARRHQLYGCEGTGVRTSSYSFHSVSIPPCSSCCCSLFVNQKYS